MTASSSFDYLVTELTAEERNALLERIRVAVHLSDEPLFSAQSMAGSQAVHGAKVDELGLMIKLLLFLRGLFSGKSREELLREDELKEIGRRIEQRRIGLIDRRRGLLLGLVAEELRGLRDSARFFYDALDRSVDRDRAAFYAFLGSIELPELHERLVEETNPVRIDASVSELRGAHDDSDVRAAAISAYDLIFSELSDKGRRAMYQDLRSVLFLKRLSGFLFDRLLGVFRETQEPDNHYVATFFESRELLLDLGDILFSMSEPPPSSLMEALFVFVEKENLVKAGDDPASVVGADMVKAEAALARIRSFNARIPLMDLLRLVSGDPAYTPRELPGGEDWLAIYKAFWRERIEKSLNDWRAGHRDKELQAEIAAFVGAPGPVAFVNISREEKENAPPIGLELALSYLDAFYRGPFLRDINRPLKVVLVDGEFYRKDNRLEFTDAYDCILHIPESLSALDAKLGPEGEFGKSWIAAKKELGPAPVKRRKMQAVARGAEEEAEQIVRRTGSALHTLVAIIQGFLKGEAGGRYDSLANLSHLDGKANKEFVKSLDRAKDRCEMGLHILVELSGIDPAQEL
jgi:hypothetical protein